MASVMCRVCGCETTRLFFVDRNDRAYRRCEFCLATLLEPSEFLSPDAERAHYLTHQNTTTDHRYRRYLSKLSEPLLQRLKPASSGLDFGCGPAAALALMMREAGHAMATYDPFFAPDTACLERVYDFVTCTETAEHFHHPGIEFQRLCGLLKPGGVLGVMTIFQTEDALFDRWRYRQDPTHVVFYREQTFIVLAANLGMTCQSPAKDVVLLTKPG